MTRTAILLLAMYAATAVSAEAHQMDGNPEGGPEAVLQDARKARMTEPIDPASGIRAVRGMVWESPKDYRQAAEDLIEMGAIGVEAVRTGPLVDEELLDLADAQGIVLYRELPGNFHSVSGLRRTAAASDSLLREILRTAERHPSAGPIGIARYADTTDPEVCELLGRLASTARSILPSVRTYYVTRFLQDDHCAEVVDFILVDLRDEPDVDAALAHLEPALLEIAHERIGLAAVGTSTAPGADPGLDTPGSPEYQARFIENALDAVHDRDLVAVFVHRFRDQAPGQNIFPTDPYGRRYGLYDRDGNPRKALQVVRGMYLGRQQVFAFADSAESGRPTPWFTLLGWMLIVIIAVMYAGSPRFRIMIPRYFLAHGFFRNAVREAREVLPLTSSALLTVTGLAIGMVGAACLLTLHSTDAAWYLYANMGRGVREAVTAVLAAPVALAVLIGSAALLAMSVWMGIWMLVSFRRSPLLPSQALMLAVWPRFPVLFLMGAVMLLQNGRGVGSIPVMVGLAVVWMLSACWSSIRTAYDLYKVVHLPAWIAGAVWILNPTILALIAVGVYILLHPGEATYFRHLVLRR